MPITGVHPLSFKPPHLTGSYTEGPSEVHRRCLVQISKTTLAVKDLGALEIMLLLSCGLGLVAGVPAGTQEGGSVLTALTQAFAYVNWSLIRCLRGAGYWM